MDHKNRCGRRFGMNTFMFLFLASLTVWASLRPVEAVEVSISPMAEPPAIDGEIRTDEWKAASGFYGFGSPLEARRGKAWFGYDSGNLYFAFKTEMPPDNKLVANVRRQGGSVVSDDSLEIWLVPPDAGRDVDGPKGKGYFQLIINSIGTVFGRHHEPGFGLPSTSWKPEINWASGIRGDYWVMEFAIPMEDLGMDELVLPSEWKILLARNWKNPWNQAAIPHSQSFSDTSSMARIYFNDGVPAVGIDIEGGLEESGSKLLMSLFNPSDAEIDAEAEIKITSGGDVALEDVRKTTISPGGTELVTFPLDFDMQESNVLSVSVKDEGGTKLFYSRKTAFTPHPGKKWTLPEADLTFHLSFDEESLIPDTAEGQAEPLKSEGEYSFIEGVSGKAVSFEEGARLLYDNARNLEIPGAVSLWVKLLRERKPAAPSAHPSHKYSTTYFWNTTYKRDGYFGVQDSVSGRLLAWFQYFPGVSNKIIGNQPFPWTTERWYHLLINVDSGGAELFFDGRKVGEASFERDLESKELSPFSLSGSGIAFDELQLFSRTLTSSEVEKIALGEQPIDGKISWFPSLNSLVAEAVSTEHLFGFPLELVVTDTDEQESFFTAMIKEEDWAATEAGTFRLRRILSLPDLPEGTYKTFLQESAKEQSGRKLLMRDFVVKHYPWADNDLGKSHSIIPPFTPIEVKGKTLSPILRDYKLGALGLPEQIVSLGKEILEGPIALNIVKNGETLRWSRVGEMQFTEVRPDLVRFEISAGNQAVDVVSEGAFEYDGLLNLKLTIDPKNNPEIDRVFLDIPVCKETAELFHAVGEHIRANPAGAVPEGDGIVFKSRSIPQPNVPDNFIPYIWVGEEQRGICWVADWDKDWIHSEERSAVELVRGEDGRVVIRVNFINGPVRLNRVREIEFGLMASPVKPMPEGWEDMVFDFDYPGRAKNTILWMGEAGFHYGWASRYPLDEDWSYMEKLIETKNTGEIDREFIKQWIKKVKELTRSKEEVLRRRVLSGFRKAKNVYEKNGRLIPYSAASERTDLLPENEVYNDEWMYRGRMHSSKSFRDYAVWYAAKMIDYGMGGIYVDNTFPAAKYTWPMGEAYIDDEGEVRPSLGVLRIRHLIKRLATMMYEKGHEPFVYVHMTNANILPMLSFAQANLGWEWKYGGADAQEKFTPEYTRAVIIGQQAGTIPVVLGGVTGGIDRKSEEFVRVSRTYLAMTLPHQIFPYSRVHAPTAIKARNIISECVVRPGRETHFYWENRGFVRYPDELMVTLHRAGDELLFVIGNLNGSGTYRIELNMENFGANRIVEAVNKESGEKIEFSENILNLDIEKHDYALIGVKIK